MTSPTADDAVPQLEARYRRSRRWNIILGALTAFLTVVLVAQLNPGTGFSTTATPSASTGPTQTAPTAAPAPGDEIAAAPAELAFVRRDPADALAVGAVDAPLVLAMWTDYRCPYCAVFSTQTLPLILDEYVETGKVRLEVHDVAFFGEQSAEAAVAARSAGRQGMFFEYLSTLYAAAPESGHPDLPRAQLIALAEEAGVPDLAAFEAGLDDTDLQAAVDASTQLAQRWGVSSVPFFVAHDQSLSGAQPVEAFRQFLDAELSRVA